MEHEQEQERVSMNASTYAAGAESYWCRESLSESDSFKVNQSYSRSKNSFVGSTYVSWNRSRGGRKCRSRENW